MLELHLAMPIIPLLHQTNGNIGLIPSYSILDLTASYKFSKKMHVKAGINNLQDAMYFTRRAGGYPGPGALPADRSKLLFFNWSQILKT